MKSKHTTSSQASKSGSWISPNRLCEYYLIENGSCKIGSGRCNHDGDNELCGFYEHRQRILSGEEVRKYWQ